MEFTILEGSFGDSGSMNDGSLHHVSVESESRGQEGKVLLWPFLLSVSCEFTCYPELLAGFGLPETTIRCPHLVQMFCCTTVPTDLIVETFSNRHAWPVVF